MKTGTWPGFVARVATPATPAEIVDDIVWGWPAVIGGEVPHGALLAVAAQVLLETGTRVDQRSTPGYWNGNAGNIRGAYAGQWTSFRAGEGYGDHAVMLEPGPANRFRSYLGPEDDATDPEVLRDARRRGVRDLLSLLERRYPAALAAAEERDFRGYVHALHAGGYFTASETAYGNAEDRLRRTIENLPQVAAFLP